MDGGGGEIDWVLVVEVGYLRSAGDGAAETPENPYIWGEV